MAELKVTRENFITIQGWMITDLKLKGNELLIYACIYGFSQAENQTFVGSLQYLADWTNSTKQGVVKCLKSLIAKGHIGKKENYINGVKFCEYYATKFNTMQQSLMGGMQQSLPNNIELDTYNQKENNTCVLQKKKESATRFQPPQVEEVIAYCEERGNNVDAQRFVDYYTANGWKVGKNAMKDWKAAVRTWERADAPKETVADDDMGYNGINYFKRLAEKLKAREQGYDGECINGYDGDDVCFLPVDI